MVQPAVLYIELGGTVGWAVQRVGRYNRLSCAVGCAAGHAGPCSGSYIAEWQAKCRLTSRLTWLVDLDKRVKKLICGGP